jgi:hypothetical protein
MLERFGLAFKILAFNGDNASPNDTQTTELDKKKNSFDVVNRVRCFNHTIQLACKALLRPFASSNPPAADDNESDGLPDLEDVSDDSSDGIEEGDNVDDREYDGVDELGQLSDDRRAIFLDQTAAVKQSITKVCVKLEGRINAH